MEGKYSLFHKFVWHESYFFKDEGYFNECLKSLSFATSCLTD